MAKQQVTALDIGSTKTCALIGQISDSGELTVTGAGLSASPGVKNGVVVDIRATAQAVDDAVSLAGQQAGCVVDAVTVGITGQHLASLNSTASIAIARPNREITAADVEKAKEAARVIVLPPDRQIIHAIPRTYTLDGQNGVRSPIGMCATRLEIECHIVHGATAFLQNVEKSISEAGLDVAEQVLQPIATAEAVLLPAEKDLGVCLLDIGGGASDLAVFVNGGIYFFSVIPVGGSHVTNDIAYGLSVATDEAERLKTQNGSSVAELVSEDDVISVRQVGRETPRRLRTRALVR
ncbi:MAG TPA: cell division protein FtsA, partial [Chthonomonadales bacterium]|nr:cell division protein FtsA [Chthonomonadales bacterium]